MIDPKYLNAIVTQPKFYDQINGMVAGATGRRSVETDDFLQLQIPLPPLEIQKEIVEKIERQKGIVEGAEKIFGNWKPDKKIFECNRREILKNLAKIQRGKFSHRPRNDQGFYGGGYPFIQINDITNNFKDILNHSQTLNEKGVSISKKFPKGTLVMSIASSIGDVGILNFDSYFPDSIVAILPNTKKMLSGYLFWYFKCFQDRIINLSSIAVQKNINVDKLEKFEINYPSLEIQKQIVTQLDKEMETLEKVRELKTQAEQRINKILEEVWGE